MGVEVKEGYCYNVAHLGKLDGEKAPAWPRGEADFLELPGDTEKYTGPHPMPLLAHQNRVNLRPEWNCSPAGHSKLIFWYIIHLAF